MAAKQILGYIDELRQAFEKQYEINAQGGNEYGCSHFRSKLDTLDTLRNYILTIEPKAPFPIGELEDLRIYAHDLTRAFTGYIGGGSEMFGKKIGNMYTADILFCIDVLRGRDDRMHQRLMEAQQQVRDLKKKLQDQNLTKE